MKKLKTIIGVLSIMIVITTFIYSFEITKKIISKPNVYKKHFLFILVLYSIYNMFIGFICLSSKTRLKAKHVYIMSALILTVYGFILKNYNVVGWALVVIGGGLLLYSLFLVKNKTDFLSKILSNENETRNGIILTVYFIIGIAVLFISK